MITGSGDFNTLIETEPGQLLLTRASDGSVVPPAAVLSAEWSSGSNAGEDITIGSTVAAQLTARFDRQRLGVVSLDGVDLSVVYAVTGASIPWGKVRVLGIEANDDIVTITACDALAWAFEGDYDLSDETLGFDWETGVDAETLLQAVCTRCGVTLGTTGLPPVLLLHWDATGYKYREILTFLACLWGRFVRINGSGQVELSWYSSVTRPVGPARYYDSGFNKADYAYTVQWIKCYAEPLEETLVVGDPTAPQGIYIKCPWMSQETLEDVWDSVGGMSYQPVMSLRFFGDPRLEPGDIISVTDRDGSVYSVPVMTLHHDYDGGLITEVSAAGKSESASELDYMGPVTRQIDKRVKDIKTSLIRYTDRIVSRVEDVEGNVSEIEQTLDSITLSVTEEVDGSGQVYAKIRLQIGPNSYSGQALVSGNVDVDGQVFADAIYADYGDVADLSVNKLRSSRRIVKYLVSDQTDDNYISIEGEEFRMISGIYDASGTGSYRTQGGETVATVGETQASNPNGYPIYWEADPNGEGVTIGPDGYPQLDGVRIFTTLLATPWPVMVYTYTDLVKASFVFRQNEQGFYQPVITLGAGDQSGNDKATLFKSAGGLEMLYKTGSGAEIGVRCLLAGYMDLYGLRKTTHIDFSGWDSGYFSETVDGNVTGRYTVAFDVSGRPVSITDGDGHVCTVSW